MPYTNVIDYEKDRIIALKQLERQKETFKILGKMFGTDEPSERTDLYYNLIRASKFAFFNSETSPQPDNLKFKNAADMSDYLEKIIENNDFSCILSSIDERPSEENAEITYFVQFKKSTEVLKMVTCIINKFCKENNVKFFDALANIMAAYIELSKKE